MENNQASRNGKPADGGNAVSDSPPSSKGTSFSRKALLPAVITAAGFLLFLLFLYLKLLSPYMYILLAAGVISFWLSDRALAEIENSGGTIRGKWLAIGTKLFSGILAALSVWGGACDHEMFYKFQEKARQSEARSNLVSIWTGQSDFHDTNNRFAQTFKELDWAPDSTGPNYAYFIGKDALQPAEGPAYKLPPEIAGKLETGEYRAAAMGNIDQDDTSDLWVITQDKLLKNIVNDVSD